MFALVRSGEGTAAVAAGTIAITTMTGALRRRGLGPFLQDMNECTTVVVDEITKSWRYWVLGIHDILVPWIRTSY